jgi:hypothetical protein
MNRVNFKNANTKSVDQSYFKPKVNVKVKKKVENKPIEVKIPYAKLEEKYPNWWTYADFNVKETDEKVIHGKRILEQIQDQKKLFTIEIPKQIKLNSEIIVENLKDDIQVTQIQNNERSYGDRGYKCWHSHNKYTLNNCVIKISDNVGGCGVQQLYFWGSNANDKDIPKLLDYILDNLDKGVGIILCQVGSMFYKSLFCKTIEKLGFKYYEEYENHQHGHGDTGRLYTLIIKKNEKNKRVTE